MQVKSRETPRQCHWYYGPTGTGKSRTAFDQAVPVYAKMQNKWWDGYQGEKIVVLDEFGKDHVCLGNHLKKWADPWTPFVAEAKGGALTPDYDIFIVTSNYSLEELFGSDEAILGPLRRRFKVHHFADPFNQLSGDLQGPLEEGIIAHTSQSINP